MVIRLRFLFHGKKGPKSHAKHCISRAVSFFLQFVGLRKFHLPLALFPGTCYNKSVICDIDSRNLHEEGTKIVNKV